MLKGLMSAEFFKAVGRGAHLPFPICAERDSDGSICSLQTCVHRVYISTNCAKTPWALMQSHTVMDAGFLNCELIISQMVPLLFSPEDTAFMISIKNLGLDSQDHRNVSVFNAAPPEGCKMTAIQRWLTASLDLLMILCTIDDENVPWKCRY